jgi:hypothetical protein
LEAILLRLFSPSRWRINRGGVVRFQSKDQYPGRNFGESGNVEAAAVMVVKMSWETIENVVAGI